MTRRLASCAALSVLFFGCSSEALNSGASAGGSSSAGAESSAGNASVAGAASGGVGANAGSLPELSRAPYAAGPYGFGVGSTIANLSFLGWRSPEQSQYNPANLVVISLSDFYNPNGAPDRPRIIWLNASAVWCTVCRAEYRQMGNTDTYGVFHPKGVEMLGVLFQDNNYKPAKPDDLVRWGGPSGFAVPFPLALDPGFKLGPYFDSDATPMNMLIDASNMQILKVTMGFDSTHPDDYWKAVDAWLAHQ